MCALLSCIQAILGSHPAREPEPHPQIEREVHGKQTGQSLVGCVHKHEPEHGGRRDKPGPGGQLRHCSAACSCITTLLHDIHGLIGPACDFLLKRACPSSAAEVASMSQKDTPCLDPELRAQKRAKFLQALKKTPEYLGITAGDCKDNIGEIPGTPTSWQYCSKRRWEGKFRRFKLAIKARWAETQAEKPEA